MLFVLSLLKHLSTLAALYCGVYHYSFYSILILSALVLSLQSVEFQEFSLAEIKPYQHDMIAKSKKVIAIALPTVVIISVSYFTGLAIHTFI